MSLMCDCFEEDIVSFPSGVLGINTLLMCYANAFECTVWKCLSLHLLWLTTGQTPCYQLT